jgi:hypothetical protein
VTVLLWILLTPILVLVAYLSFKHSPGFIWRQLGALALAALVVFAVAYMLWTWISALWR